MLKDCNRKNTGFSLLEVLMVVAMIGILASMSFPVYLGLIKKNELDNMAVSVVQNLRRAQFLSRAVKLDSSWGVNITNNKITLFKGTSYAARDTLYDEETTFSGEVSVSGLTEVVYTRFSGAPTSVGSLTLAVQSNTQVISINSMGMIDY